MKFNVLVNGKTRSLQIQQANLLANGRGGSGSVYRVTDPLFPKCVAKIYHIAATPNQAAKLSAMIARPPQNLLAKSGALSYPQFAWPIAVLLDAQGHCAGFLMPEIDVATSVSLITYVEDREALKKLTPEQRSLPARMQVAANIAALMAELHRLGHAFIDIKDQNIRVFPHSGLVAFIDCDGYSIANGAGKNYPAPLATLEYASPEWLRSAATDSLGEKHDRFVMAILLFKLLNRGVHPFQGIPKSKRLLDSEEFSPQLCIGFGIYPYGVVSNPELAHHPASIHEGLHDNVLGLFQGAFTAAQPWQRPSARQWNEQLRTLIADKPFSRCRQRPTEIEHIRFSGKPCPICQDARAGPVLNSAKANSASPSLRNGKTKSPFELPTWLMPAGVAVSALCVLTIVLL